MILSAHQPAYLPWLGYFDKILKSDVFVYLDSVQFEKNSFINRNLIKTPQGPLWLTVPVYMKGHIDSNMTETRIDYTQKWKIKHLRSLEQYYRKAPRFDYCFPKIQELYQKDSEFLSNLCFDHLCFWLSEFKIEKKIIKSSTLDLHETKSKLVLELCKIMKSDHYLSGALGRDYLDVKEFSDAGIKVEFQEFHHPTYAQLHGNFLPNMGIVDYWMNCESLGVSG